MFLASTPVGGAPMAGDRLQPFTVEAQTASLGVAGQAATTTGREVTGLSAARQTMATRLKDPVQVPSGAAMSAFSDAVSNTEVQP